MSVSAIVKSIARRGDTSLLISVEIKSDCGHELVEFVVLDELYESLDLSRGDDVSELLPTLDAYTETTAAYMSACSSFAYVPSSVKALYRKLIRKGFSKESSAEAIEIVRARGFIDEEAIARRRAELMVSKLWGRSRIIRKLREEEFSDSVIKRTLDDLDGVDFAENCAKVIEKKYSRLPSERKEREKMYASLSRLGYSTADIKGAISLLDHGE